MPLKWISKQKIQEQEATFNLYKKYESIRSKNENNILSFDTLISRPLLHNNVGFSSNEYINIKNMINEAVNKKYDLIFDEFTITFNLNLKYSTSVMIPMVTNHSGEMSDNFAANLTSSDDYLTHKILRDFNNEITNFLGKGYYLEIIPNTILFYHNQELKLFFSKELSVKIQ